MVNSTVQALSTPAVKFPRDRTCPPWAPRTNTQHHNFLAGETPQHQRRSLTEAKWRTQSLTSEVGVCEHGCAGTEELSVLLSGV